MALTPLDIQNKTFPTKMRGYNQDEVDDFLDLVVRDYEEITQRNRELEKAVKHSEEKLEYFNELKDALNQSIIVAQDTADKVKTSASKESEVIVTSAQNKADELVATAEKRAHQLTTDAEEKARQRIDKQLTDAGWEIVARDEYVTDNAMAVKEALMKGNGESDYLMFVDNKAIAVVEAKREENTLGDIVAEQTEKYAVNPKSWYGLWFNDIILLFI